MSKRQHAAEEGLSSRCVYLKAIRERSRTTFRQERRVSGGGLQSFKFVFLLMFGGGRELKIRIN